VFRMTTRPVHKLVMVIPVEEQIATTGDMEEREKAPPTARALTPSRAAVTELGQAGPPGAEPEAACQAELETEKGRGPEVAEPHPPLDGGGAARPPTELRRVILKKKANRQARPVVVRVPREEAEMMDIGARPRKRGRPRKPPKVDPPDPHKGSVLHPRKGGCADPVNGDAILEEEKGGKPHSQDRERQLASDTGGDKT
jgi:hypothetical protein